MVIRATWALEMLVICVAVILLCVSARERMVVCVIDVVTVTETVLVWAVVVVTVAGASSPFLFTVGCLST